jgi:hypothetical protein
MSKYPPEQQCIYPGCENKRKRAKTKVCVKHIKAPDPDRINADRDHVVRTLEKLTAQGFSLNVIGKEAGVNPAVLHRVYSQGFTLRKTTYNKVLRWARTTKRAKITHTSVWPSQRRLQALYAAGMTTAEMCEVTGCNRQTLRKIAFGKKSYLNSTTALKIDAMWKTHSDRKVTPPAKDTPKHPDGTPVWALPDEEHNNIQTPST